MINRKSYDTRIKYLAREGLLPETYRKNIHRSLICKWKQEPVEKYVGYELNTNMEELYELMKAVSNDERLVKALRAIYRINKTLKNVIASGGEYISKLKENKTEVITTIQRAGKSIGLTKACKLMGISKSAFRVWAMETYFKCNHSIHKLCSNAYPSQLTYEEIKKMHQLLSHKSFITWPVKSVAYYGIKHEIVKAHVNTWYKYNRLLKIKRMKYKKIRKKYDEGIRAKYPNEKWHADVTELLLKNGQTAFIYLVIDNFSRLILSWRVADKLCADIRLDTFREAVINSRIRKRNIKRIKKTQLIVDGGSENHNKTVNKFILRKDTPLNKVTALKDILKSNALAESTNKTLKYEYLFAKPSFNILHLNKTMQKSVYDFNCVRPHGAIQGLTPIEAYTGMKVNTRYEKKMMCEARQDRMIWNQNHKCNGCPFGCSV